jgi:CRP-like cAMP-binding protein
MQPEARTGRLDAVAPRPLAELLQCPSGVGGTLSQTSQCLNLECGEALFRQREECRGLYLIVSGKFQRRTERLNVRLTLGYARPGDVVEISAALCNGSHTYTLIAVEESSVLLLPQEALNGAFQAHRPLRMRLLEELAREVSRGYDACCHMRWSKPERRGRGAVEH